MVSAETNQESSVQRELEEIERGLDVYKAGWEMWEEYKFRNIPPSLRRTVRRIFRELDLIVRYAQFRLRGLHYQIESGFENNMPFVKIKVLYPMPRREL